MTGVEPNLRWRSYSTAILDVAERMGAKMLISLGALIADVAHTLPSRSRASRARRAWSRSLA